MTSPTIATILVAIDQMASRLDLPSHDCEVAISRERTAANLGAVCWTVRATVLRMRSGTATLAGYGDTIHDAISMCESSVTYNRKAGKVR